MGRGDAAAATWIESEVRKRKIRKTPRQKKTDENSRLLAGRGRGRRVRLGDVRPQRRLGVHRRAADARDERGDARARPTREINFFSPFKMRSRRHFDDIRVGGVAATPRVPRGYSAAFLSVLRAARRRVLVEETDRQQHRPELVRHAYQRIGRRRHEAAAEPARVADQRRLRGGTRTSPKLPDKHPAPRAKKMHLEGLPPGASRRRTTAPKWRRRSRAARTRRPRSRRGRPGRTTGARAWAAPASS